jgi:hypothetical protein
VLPSSSGIKEANHNAPIVLGPYPGNRLKILQVTSQADLHAEPSVPALDEAQI